MNEFDERYEIRLGQLEDIDMIMKFINDCWKQGHIMSQSRALFEYEYLDTDGKTVNVILAIERKTGELEGIFGFLKCSDKQNSEKRDIWGSIWKVNPDHENMPLLGIELAKRAYTITGCRYHIGNGANPETTVLLRKLYFGEKTARMVQYYYLNEKKEDFKIAVVRKKWKSIEKKDIAITRMRRFASMAEVREHFDIESLDAIPYKDNWYLEKRFFKHPWYSYQVYGLSLEEGKIEALFVAREIECHGNKILRIVDYMGKQSLFSGLGWEIRKLADEKDYEYIDFYVYGFDEAAILAAGFKKRDDEDENIIPNYFEPFVQENVDIWVHYKAEGTTFFKADGDQDRPNVLPEK